MPAWKARAAKSPAVPGLPVLGVEIDLARSREMALTDDDVLVRRTRLSTMDATVRLPAPMHRVLIILV